MAEFILETNWYQKGGIVYEELRHTGKMDNPYNPDIFT